MIFFDLVLKRVLSLHTIEEKKWKTLAENGKDVVSLQRENSDRLRHRFTGFSEIKAVRSASA